MKRNTKVQSTENAWIFQVKSKKITTKQSLCIPPCSDMTAVRPPSPTEMWHFSFFWSVGMTLLCYDRDCDCGKISCLSHFRNKPPSSHPPFSPQYFLKPCRARVRGVSWVFDLAGAHPFSLQASGALDKEKKSPIITCILSSSLAASHCRAHI